MRMARVYLGGRPTKIGHAALMEALARTEEAGMKDLGARALDTLAALLDAVSQAGPGPADLDIDHAALAGVVTVARTVLYEAGRLDV